MKTILLTLAVVVIAGCVIVPPVPSIKLRRPLLTNAPAIKAQAKIKVSIPSLPKPHKYTEKELNAIKVAKMGSVLVQKLEFFPANFAPAAETNILYDEFVYGGRNWVSVRWGSNSFPTVSWGLTVDSMPNILFTTGCSVTGVDRWTISFPTNITFITATNTPCEVSDFGPAGVVLRFGGTKSVERTEGGRREKRILTRVESGDFTPGPGVEVYAEFKKKP